MTGVPGIDAVAVVVPARDEGDRIGACLRAVARALAALPARIDAAVYVVADRCSDSTAGIARAHGARVIVSSRELGVGGVRELGVAAALARPDLVVERTWLLHTDADTVVAPDWALRHLRHAERGADLVAGLADLDDTTHLTTRARAAYAQLHVHDPAPFDDVAHGHVFGANLGVRADVHLAVGGFPHSGSGEDHALVARVGAAGYRVVAPADVRVRTSARTRGRATGGLADLLAALDPALERAGPVPP